jgi:hypothetical protein
VAGTDYITVKLNGTVIDGGTLYASVVSAGAAVAANSFAAVPGTGEAGVSTGIVIVVRDAQGNTVPGLNVARLVVSIGGANADSSAGAIQADTGTTYSTSYTPTAAGVDQITITLDGSGISGSPYSSTVAPTGVTLDSILASVPDGAAGSPTNVNIFVRDQFGNRVPGQAGKLAATVTGANPQALSTPVEQGDTSYVTSYTPLNTGADTVAIT